MLLIDPQNSEKNLLESIEMDATLGFQKEVTRIVLLEETVMKTPMTF